MLQMYGIKNCDTVKKARKFLDDKKVAYEFHDFKKEAPTKKQRVCLNARKRFDDVPVIKSVT